MAMITATAAFAALARRAALVSLALACAAWQPTTYDDAINTRNAVCALFDAEIVATADAGLDATYQSLRDLRAKVALDLATRATALPQIITVTLRTPEPSLVVAYRLYGDATREADMVQRANPRHPGFMPLSFAALSY